MTAKYEKSLRVYKMSLEDLHEDLIVDRDFPEEDKLAWALDELFTFRYRLSGKEVEKLDAEYLPQLYGIIKERYPNLISFFLRNVKSVGIDSSLLEKLL